MWSEVCRMFFVSYICFKVRAMEVVPGEDYVQYRIRVEAERTYVVFTIALFGQDGCSWDDLQGE